MESDTLIDGDSDSTTNGYNSVLAAGAHGPKFTQKTVFGEVRNWKRFSWLEWTFLLVAVFSIIGILAESIMRFIRIENNFRNISIYGNETQPYVCNEWICTNDFIFTVVLVLNIAFSAGYVVDGLLREKMFEMVGYAVTILVIMAFVVFNYAAKSKEWKNPFRLIRLVIVVIVGPINIVLSSIVSYKMGYFIFHTVGSNTALIRAYKVRSFFLTLQCILLQLMANVLALSWWNDKELLPIGEKVIVCLLLAHCVVVLVLGWIAVMFEKHWLVPVWYFLMAPYFAYFVYKIVHVSVHYKENYGTEVLVFEPHKIKGHFEYIGAIIIGACSVGLLVLVMLYVFMALALKNFKMGLREKLPPPVDVWRGIFNRLTFKLQQKS